MIPNRKERVAQNIKMHLSEIMMIMPIPACEKFQISNIKVSPDFRYADIDLISFGCNDESMLNAIRDEAPRLRKKLSSKIKLRFVPELRFHLDKKLIELSFEISPGIVSSAYPDIRITLMPGSSS